MRAVGGKYIFDKLAKDPNLIFWGGRGVRTRGGRGE